MRCVICGGDHDSGQWVWGATDRVWYCVACFEGRKASGHVSQCLVCGAWLMNRSSEGYDSSGHICAHCYSQGYRVCSNCSGVADNVNSDGHCRSCALQIHAGAPAVVRDAEDRSVIHEYRYTPEFLRFRRTDDDNLELDPYLGFELEVDSPECSHPNINGLARLVTEDEVCWCKHDGSLAYGFEMVSHPMTLRAHKATPWAWRLRSLLDGGVESAACDTCALHIHVARDFLAPNQWLKLDDWVSEHQEFVIKIAQRHSVEYAKFHSDMDETTCRQAREGSYKYQHPITLHNQLVVIG